MKKKMLLIMMLLITLSGSYKKRKQKRSITLMYSTETLYTSESGPPVFITFPKDITVKEDSCYYHYNSNQRNLPYICRHFS